MAKTQHSTPPQFLPGRPPPPPYLNRYETDTKGIVIKYESMESRAAVHQAALVLDLASKSKKYMRELFEPPDVRPETNDTHRLHYCRPHSRLLSECSFLSFQWKHDITSLRGVDRKV